MNNLGIFDDGYVYHILQKGQNKDQEFLKTQNFLNWVINDHPDLFSKSAKVKFINYGDTQLVYVIDDQGYKRTLLVGQPQVKLKTVKTEYENLLKLYQINPDLVVCPTNYFCNGQREAYLTPYIYQARCIASSHYGYGSYVLEPTYHFKKYSVDDAYMICKIIIANLISLYNTEQQLGIASCKIGGGDFILEKGYDQIPHTTQNTLNNIHLIAAREFIKCDSIEYINLLKIEFSQVTYYNDISLKDPNILINHKNRFAMSNEAIEDGIRLGLILKGN